jgi:hypothetical protein
MLRPKDKWPEFVALGCGAAALVAWFLGNETIAVGAVIAGVLVLGWSYLDVRR